MKTSPLTNVLAAALGLALLGGCTQDDATVADTTTPMTDDTLASPTDMGATDPNLPRGADPATTGMATNMQPAQVLAVVAVVDQNEIDAAEQAREKNVEGEVLEFANMLHSEHTANMEKGTELMSTVGGTAGAMGTAGTTGTGAGAGSTADTTGAMSGAGGADMAQAERQKGEAMLQRLEAMDGEAYADAWVDAMVQAHSDAIATIDNQLMAAATDEQVRNHLTESRAAIERHLEMGRQLQGDAQ